MPYRNPSSSPVFSLRREIDRLFEDTFGNVQSQGAGRGEWIPAVDIREDDKELTLEFELPGVAPDHVEVTAEKGVLTVRGEKRGERKEGDEEGRYHLIERSYGSFSRSFQLPQGIDEERIEAQFENGVLKVRIPKAALPQPRRIEIKSGAQPSQRSVQQPSQQSSRPSPSTHPSPQRQPRAASAPDEGAKGRS
jgi:HSP20 family protein